MNIRIDKEAAKEVLERYKHQVLQLVPASGRYSKYLEQTKKSVNGAASLEFLSDAIDAYLEAINPEKPKSSDEETSEKKDTPEDEEVSREHSETAPISAFNIIERNLLKVKSKIDEAAGI